MYSTTTDLQARFAPAFLRALADDDADATPDAAIMQRAILDADAYIDARLAARYNTPFGAAPPLISELSSVLAGRNLARRLPSTATTYHGDFERADQLLAMLASGEAFLPGVPRRAREISLEGVADPGGDDGGRVFSREVIDGF